MCDHPMEERWQYPDSWMCCKCWRYFWGDKRFTPKTDIYGKLTSEVKPCVKE